MTIEFADYRSGPEAVIRRAPAAVRAHINRARVARGLDPVYTAAEVEARLAGRAAAQAAGPSGPGVWVTGPRGSLVPATSPRATRSPAQPQAARGPVVERVLIVPTFGDQPANTTGNPIAETVARGAFGSAADLNRFADWTLQDGHHGAILATAGPRLRAIDTPEGLIVEWLPDDSAAHRAIVAEIDKGRTGISVSMKIGSAKIEKYGQLVRSITEARLTHIAILPTDDCPAYPGARAAIFRDGRRDDPVALRKQIDKLLERCRWYDRQAKVRAGR